MSPERHSFSVLYDHRGFLLETGGVSRYYTELIKRLPEWVHWRIAVRRTANLYLKNEPFCVPPIRQEYTSNDFVRDVLQGHRIRGINRLFRILRRIAPELVHADAIANDRYFRRLARARDIDLIHLTEPHFFDYDWQRIVRHKPFVVTVHDLIPELIWKWDQIRSVRKCVLNAASGIIAVSQFTKEKIVGEYGIPESKIKVIYHGYLSMGSTKMESILPNQKYILYVGRRKSLGDYKNFPFFIHEIAPLLTSRPDLFLVCTGKPFDDFDYQLFRATRIVDKVIHYFASDEQMPSLFANAEAFIYPSKMEGFGIPILDAFHARCPVVLSRSSCLPEIAGNAALYFAEGDGEGLRMAITTILDNSLVRRNFIEKGSERIKLFSWEKCARETFSFYTDVLNNSDNRTAFSNE